jgi:hypothetical protein
MVPVPCKRPDNTPDRPVLTCPYARAANESTNSRVMWFAFLEAAVLVGMGVWQIYHLRSFFEKKRRF